MPRIQVLLVVVGLLAPCTTLWATDYSRLVDPRYARILILPGKRVQQAECAGLALHFAETRPEFSKDIARRIADAVTRRLGVDLGDPEVARELVETKAGNHADPGYQPDHRAAVVKILEGHCQGIFGAASKGDAALEAALGPVPAKPIELPDPGYCLAVMGYADERKDVDRAGDFKRLLQEAWIDQAAPAERAKRTATVMTATSMLRSLPLTPADLHDMVYACFPTMNEVIPESRTKSDAADR